MNKKTRVMYVLFIMLIAIMIFIPNVVKATNWSVVDYVKVKDGTPAYANATGEEMVKTSVKKVDVYLTGSKTYKYIEKSGNRIKINFSVNVFSYDGYVDVSAVESYTVIETELVGILEKYEANKNSIDFLTKDTAMQWRKTIENNFYRMFAGELYLSDEETKMMKEMDLKLEQRISDLNAKEFNEEIKDGKVTEEEISDLSGTELLNFLKENNVTDLNISDEAKEKLKEQVNNDTTLTQDQKNIAIGRLEGKTFEVLDRETGSSKYFNNPLFPDQSTGDSASSEHTADEIITEGDSFINKGKNSSIPTISQIALNNTSNTIYNILLVVGTVVSVIWGLVLGIKYMMGSIEEQADIKGSLLPYVIGSVIMFGSFGIWKIVILVLSQLN